jgi:hypothetical protein
MNIYLAARLSLSFLWIFTGITSAFFSLEYSYELLENSGITGTLASFSIYSGSLLDVVIGVWLITGKRLKLCYQIQLLVVVLYSLLLTIIEPNFWVHPFGPLTKNIPILVMIYYLYTKESRNT